MAVFMNRGNNASLMTVKQRQFIVGVSTQEVIH